MNDRPNLSGVILPGPFTYETPGRPTFHLSDPGIPPSVIASLDLALTKLKIHPDDVTAALVDHDGRVTVLQVAGERIPVPLPGHGQGRRRPAPARTTTRPEP